MKETRPREGDALEPVIVMDLHLKVRPRGWMLFSPCIGEGICLHSLPSWHMWGWGDSGINAPEVGLCQS